MSDQHGLDSYIDRVRQFEQAFINAPQVDLQTSHVIHGGMYARTIFIPAGTVVTGALTSLDNICIINGNITVTTDTGTQHLIGCHVLPASKGYKRIGFAHEDTYWTMMIRTDASSIEQAEDEATVESNRLQTRRDGVVFDWSSKARSDYNAFLCEFGITLGFVDARMRDTSDLIETDGCFRKMMMAPSSIHGIGVFATTDLVDGEIIAPARRDWKRCIAGRFTNHSHDPNAVFIPTGVGDGIDMVAIKDIKEGDEITVDYRVSGRVAYALEREMSK